MHSIARFYYSIHVVIMYEIKRYDKTRPKGVANYITMNHPLCRLLCMARKLKLTVLFIYFLICTLPFILLP